MNIGDVITTAEEFDTIPVGAAFLADGHLWQWFGLGAQTPMRSLTGGGWTYPGEALLEYGRFVIVYTPGHLPRPERVVKAEALREHRRRVVRFMPPGLVNRATVVADLDDYANRLEAGEAL